MTTKNRPPALSDEEVTHADVSVVRRGESIQLPEGMSYDEGIIWLRRRKEEDEAEVKVYEETTYYPLDGAVALQKALARRFGWVNLVPTPGFFGPTPPAMVGVEVGYKTTLQVPWGRIMIPGVEGYVQTIATRKEGRDIFVLAGVVKQKHKALVHEIAESVRTILKEESIYRSKAIRLKFAPENAGDDVDLADFMPRFLDVSNVREEELILPEDVMALVKASIFTPIEKTKLVKEYGVPLKRGVLLEGPYGVGKTLTAYVAAKKAVNSGWTFIYLESVADLHKAVVFANNYAPAVIFAEDIDRVTNGGRTHELDAILNTIDGVISKNSELMVVLTTNNVESIHQAMLRPGRLDAVISVSPPDALASQKLVRLYARGLIHPEDDLSDVGQVLAGHIPAVIREVVERSKLYAVGKMESGQTLMLKADDLLYSAKSMVRQLDLLKKKDTGEVSVMELFGSQLGKAVTAGVKEASAAMAVSSNGSVVGQN